MTKTELIQGTTGNLEISATSPEQAKNITTIISHPHPLYGGTMDNKVVTTLMKTFTELQTHTVRFNFRGVGKSSGHYDQGIGELEDLFSVMRWVKKNRPADAIWLAGFSFGAYISAKAATQLHVAKLVTVAPPISLFDLTALPEITCPWIIVQGEQDELVSCEKVVAWVETLAPRPALIRIEGATHFFHGKLQILKEELLAYFKRKNS